MCRLSRCFWYTRSRAKFGVAVRSGRTRVFAGCSSAQVDGTIADVYHTRNKRSRFRRFGGCVVIEFRNPYVVENTGRGLALEYLSPRRCTVLFRKAQGRQAPLFPVQYALLADFAGKLRYRDDLCGHTQTVGLSWEGWGRYMFSEGGQPGYSKAQSQRGFRGPPS